METADFDYTKFTVGNAGPQPGDETLLVRFFSKPVQNKKKSLEENRPIFEDQIFVGIKVPGERNEKCFPASDYYKQRFPRHWDAYEKRTGGIEAEGTPLNEWPMITRSQAEELKYYNLYTVEQLAQMSDSNAQNVQGFQNLKEKAKAYLIASKDATAVANREEDKAELEELKAQVAALTAQLADKPKRGRPKKEDSEKESPEE